MSCEKGKDKVCKAAGPQRGLTGPAGQNVETAVWAQKTGESGAACSIPDQAAQFIREQFGCAAKWVWINQALWQYFEAGDGERLGLSGMRRIASEIEVSVDEITSVVSLLTASPHNFLRCVYYRRTDSGQTQIVPIDELAIKLRAWWREKTTSQEEWEQWASDVLVGWEPTHA